MSNLVVLVGRYSSGKSTTFYELMQQIQGKCLVLDPGGATVYQEFPELDPSRAWMYTNPDKQGRFWRVQDTGDRAAELSWVFGCDPETKQYRKTRAYLNGNLFLEDAGAYLDSNLSRTARSRVKAMKQHGLNLFLSYHSLDEISTEVIRMVPSIIMLKKTGDLPVFAQIASKVRKLGNYHGLRTAFYRARFRGLDTKAVRAEVSEDELVIIARDLQIDLKALGINGKELTPKSCDLIAAEISYWANKKRKLSKAEKEQGNFHTETIIMRK